MTLRSARRWLRGRRRAFVAQALIAALLLQLVAAALPPAGPFGASTANAETLASPRYVSAAVMPNGQVGLLFANGDNGINTAAEIRFVAYTSEHAIAASLQLSTAGPAYPQLATYRGRLVAGYVDSRGADDGRFIVRISDDNGLTWSTEAYPFGGETFDRWTLAPRLVSSRDGQTLYFFDATGGSRPRYRTSTDPDLVTWSAPAEAGDATMVVAQASSCGSSGEECLRAHAFSFMETGTPGSWVYVARSLSGSFQSGRGTQVGALGGSWSAQVDHGGSGGQNGCCGESTATTFLDRAGFVYYLRAGSFGESLYWKRSSDGGYTWSAQLQMYEPLPDYTTGAPVGLYVPGYTFGEYIWYAGFGGTEDTLRVVPLRTVSLGVATDPDTDRLFGTTTYTATGSGLSGVDFAPAFDGDDQTAAIFQQTNNATSQLVVTLPAGPATIRSIKVKMTVLHLLGLSGGGSVRVYCGSGTGGPLLWQQASANVHVVDTGRIDVADCSSSQLTLWWSHANGGTGCEGGASDSCLYTFSAWSYGFGVETPARPYVQTGTARLMGSAGGDLDPGSAFPYNNGDEVRSLGAGAYTTSAVDLTLPGRLLPLVFARTYNSADPSGGTLGPGWTHSFEWSVSENADMVTLRRGDGRQDRFVRQPDGSYLPEPGVFDTLAKNADGTFTLTTREQVGYDFGVTGQLARIHEPAGNQISLAYAANRLSAITDTVGRQVQLTYDTTGRLIRLLDGAGRQVRYAYDGYGRLATVGDKLAMASVAPQYAGEVLADAPTAHWRLGESAGPTAADQMGVAAGTYSAGGVAYGTLPGIVDSDTAVGLNGSGYATASGSGPLNITAAAVSVEAWVRGGGQGNFKYIVSKSDNNGAVGYSLYTGATGTLRFFVNTANSGLVMAIAPTGPWDLAWHHVVGTYNGSLVRLYVDGIEVAAAAASGAITSSATRTLDIGRFNGGGLNFVGEIDEVAVYASALPAARVAAHYTAGHYPAAVSWAYGYVGGSRHLATITDPDGRVVVTNTYDPQGRLATQTDGAAKTSTFAYPASQMVTTDPRGNATTLTYDARNRVIERADLVGGQALEELLVYDGCGNLSALIDRRGQRTDYTYDPACRGNLLVRQEPQIDPFTPRYTTTYEYDARNNLTRLLDALGFETTRTYDPATNVSLSTTQQIDATTYATTKWEYGDAANPGLPTKVISPRGNSGPDPDYAFATALAYDAQANLVSSTDPDGGVTTHFYDSLGRRVATVDPEGNALGGVPTEPEPFDTVRFPRVTRMPDGNAALLYHGRPAGSSAYGVWLLRHQDEDTLYMPQLLFPYDTVAYGLVVWDGKLLAVARIPGSGVIRYRTSSDNGASWSQEADLGPPSGSPNLVRAPVGGTAGYSASSEFSGSFVAGKAADGDAGTDWATAGSGTGAIWWRSTWGAAQALDRVVLRDRANGTDWFGSGGGTIAFSDGSSVPFSGLANNGAQLTVNFPRKSAITWIEVQTSGSAGPNPGLAEVEAYDVVGLGEPFQLAYTRYEVAWQPGPTEGGGTGFQLTTNRAGDELFIFSLADANNRSHQRGNNGGDRRLLYRSTTAADPTTGWSGLKDTAYQPSNPSFNNGGSSARNQGSLWIYRIVETETQGTWAVTAVQPDSFRANHRVHTGPLPDPYTERASLVNPAQDTGLIDVPGGPITARYWKVALSGGGPANSPEVFTFELADGTVNWATAANGAVATASSTFSSFTPANAIDENDTTKWVAGNWPATLFVDLGAPRTISKFRVYQSRGPGDPEAPTYAPSVVLSSGDSAVSWTHRLDMGEGGGLSGGQGAVGDVFLDQNGDLIGYSINDNGNFARRWKSSDSGLTWGSAVQMAPQSPSGYYFSGSTGYAVPAYGGGAYVWTMEPPPWQGVPNTPGIYLHNASLPENATRLLGPGHSSDFVLEGEGLWRTAYDANDRVTRETDPLGNSTLYGYDGAGNRTGLTDRSGNVTAYAYDGASRLWKVEQRPDPSGQPSLIYTTTLARDDAGNVTSVAQANGVVTDHGYDALNRLVSTTTHPSPTTPLTTSYLLDGNGNVTSRTTADGVTTTYLYDSLDRLTGVSAPGVAIGYAYDARSRRTSMSDATGPSTYGYDGLGRLTQAVQPSGTLGYGYDLDSNLTSLAYPGGATVAYAFSNAGRLASLTDWAQRTTTYAYSPAGRPTAVSLPGGMTTTYAYDGAGRLVQLTNAVGPITASSHAYTLDPEGNRTALDELLDTRGGSLRVNADSTTTAQDRPAIALGPDGAAYLVWDDARGGNADIYFGRRDPATGAWGANVKVNTDTGTRAQLGPAIALDASGNATAAWTDYREGNNNNPDANIYASRRSAATGSWSANLRVNDDSGPARVQRDVRIASTSSGDATAVWVDLRSNQKNVYSSTLAAGGSAWAANKRVSDNTSADKEAPDIALGPDGTAYAVWQDHRNGNADIYFSQLAPGASAWSANVKISDDAGTAAQRAPRIGADALGNLTVLWLDDRTTPAQLRMSTLAAGSSQWSASVAVTDAPARPVSLALAVHPDGSAWAAWGDTRGSSPAIYGAQYEPGSGWSASVRLSDGPASGAQSSPSVALGQGGGTLAWRDDRSGDADVRARALPASSLDHFDLAYDGLLRLTEVAGPVPEGFSLDAASNIASRTGPVQTNSYDGANRLTGDGLRAFTWSDADRLVGRGADTFAYDPLDRLSASTVAGISRSYAYSGDGLLQSRTQGATTSFLWDPSTSPSRLLQVGSERIVHGLGPLYAERSDGSTLAFARDGLGSVRAELDGSGAVTAAFRYRAYGEIAQSWGAAAPSYLGYAGELLDPSGLIYLRARWYDPVVGRFLTRDPVMGDPAAPRTLNLYGYAAGNPALLIDPSGLAFRTDDSGCSSIEDCTSFDELASGRFRDVASSLPDYYKLTVNLAIPNPLTLNLVGVSGSITVDRYLQVFVAGGGTVGKSVTGVSASATAGYLLQGTVPPAAELDTFSSGWTVSGGGGWIVGGQATYSPGADLTRWAIEAGLFSPQAGVSATYGWRWR